MGRTDAERSQRYRARRSAELEALRARVKYLEATLHGLSMIEDTYEPEGTLYWRPVRIDDMIV